MEFTFPGYIAAVLTEDARATIVHLARYKIVSCRQVVLTFCKDAATLARYQDELGCKVRIEITHFAHDKHIQVMMVANVNTDRKTPYILLSKTSEKLPDSHADTMLIGAVMRKELEPTCILVEATIQFVPRQ